MIPPVNRLFILLMVSLLLASCGGGGDSGSGSTPVSVTIGSAQKGAAKNVAAPVPTDANHVRLFVEANDISPRIETETDVTPGQTATLAVTVPNGNDRRFEVWAYNNGAESYAGITQNINLTGTPVTVSVDMQPVACTFQLTPQVAGIPANGTAVPIQISPVAPSPANCGWMVIPNSAAPWITVTPKYGFGTQQIMVGAQPNTTGAMRFGDITVGGVQLLVDQQQ